MPSTLGIFPGSGFPETKGSRVTRIMQSIQRGTQSQPLPDQLAGAHLPASSEFELILSKGCQSAQWRDMRDTSSPITMPALPRLTSVTSFWKPSALGCRSSRLTLVAIDNFNVLGRPTQDNRPLTQRILALHR